jgi:hypothetical protein
VIYRGRIEEDGIQKQTAGEVSLSVVLAAAAEARAVVSVCVAAAVEELIDDSEKVWAPWDASIKPTLSFLVM